MTRRRPIASYEDLVRVPEYKVAELVDGELFASPRPAPRHANATTELASVLRDPFHHGRGGPGGWQILFEPELHLRDDVLVPDVAGWRRQRMPALPEEAYFELAPDWVCEVVSPSTGPLDRTRKLPVYAREGVSHAWIVDPLLRTLEALELAGGRWQLVAAYGGEEQARIVPFEAIELDLARLWV
jgi:Uma2 family endonuclease